MTSVTYAYILSADVLSHNNNADEIYAVANIGSDRHWHFTLVFDLQNVAETKLHVRIVLTRVDAMTFYGTGKIIEGSMMFFERKISHIYCNKV